MKKILFITSLSGKRINGFMLSSILAAKEAGYEFHIASNQLNADSLLYFKDCEDLGITPHHIDFKRNPFHPNNIRAYNEINELMKREEYDIVHCNTPIGGVIGRFSARRANIKKVIYMAHGFHFWKGSPLINWVIYYIAERWLARYTDILITINHEDFARAQKFKARKIVYIPGVGIKQNEVVMEKSYIDTKRVELGVTDSITLLSVGELSKRKNHTVVIEALAKMKEININYLICGQGKLSGYLVKLAKELGVEDKVKFLGFRTDISEICNAVDIFVFPSIQEGLPIALMEAMSAGLPVVCSRIRGNVDLVSDGEGGYLVEPKDIDGFVVAITKLIQDRELRKVMGNNNAEFIKRFELKNVVEEMKELYINTGLQANIL